MGGAGVDVGSEADEQLEHELDSVVGNETSEDANRVDKIDVAGGPQMARHPTS